MYFQMNIQKLTIKIGVEMGISAVLGKEESLSLHSVSYTEGKLLQYAEGLNSCLLLKF